MCSINLRLTTTPTLVSSNIPPNSPKKQAPTTLSRHWLAKKISIKLTTAAIFHDSSKLLSYLLRTRRKERKSVEKKTVSQVTKK